MSGFSKTVNLRRIHVYRHGTSAGPMYVAENFFEELEKDPAIDPNRKYVGAYVPERTCATCRHYERNDPDNGTCDRIGAGMWEQTPNGEACLPIDNDTYSKHGRGALQLYVSDTFGCVLHEDKGG